MKELRTTDKQKFDTALALMWESTRLYREAEKVFNSLGIYLHTDAAPISYSFGYNQFSFFTGIKVVAEINGTELCVGNKAYAPNNPKYLTTEVDGILFSTLEGEDA